MSNRFTWIHHFDTSHSYDFASPCSIAPEQCQGLVFVFRTITGLFKGLPGSFKCKGNFLCPCEVCLPGLAKDRR